MINSWIKCPPSWIFVNKLEYAILLSLISLALLFYSLLGECGHAYVKKSACSQNKTKIYINAPSCDGDARTLHSAVRYGAAMRGQEKTTVLITFTFESTLRYKQVGEANTGAFYTVVIAKSIGQEIVRQVCVIRGL